MTIHPADGTFNYQFPLTLPAGTWLERFPNDVAAWEPASASSLRPDVTVVTAAGLTPAGTAATTTTVGTWRAENATQGGTPTPGDAYLSVMPVGDSSIHFHVTDVNGKDCTAELAAIKVGDTLTYEDSTGTDGYEMTVSSIQGTTFSGPLTTHGNPTVNEQLILTVDSPQVPTAGQKNDEFINTADGKSWIHDGTRWVEIGSSRPAVTVSSTAGETPVGTPASSTVLGIWNLVTTLGTPIAPGEVHNLNNNTDLRFNVVDRNGQDWRTELEAIQVGDELVLEEPYSQPMPIDGYTLRPTRVDTVSHEFFGPLNVVNHPVQGAQLQLTVNRPARTTPGELNDEWINTADNRHWIHDGLQLG